jgi:hypothetical protein
VALRTQLNEWGNAHGDTDLDLELLSTTTNTYDTLGRQTARTYNHFAWMSVPVTDEDVPAPPDIFHHDFTYSYDKRESYLEKSVAGTSSTPNYRETTSTSTYDALGRRIAVQEHTPLPKDYGEMEDRVRFFAYDAGAGILTRRDGTLDDNNHFDSGSTTLQKHNNVHHYTYVNGQSVAHLTEAGELDVTSRLTAFDTQAGTGAALVQENDTLQSIAQRTYGDSGLWYVLAEANAIHDNDDLVVGMTLRTPAVKTVSNSSSTYQPYDPSQVIGPTTPDLPWITPPPKAGCDAVAMILMAVVAVAIICAAPELSAAFGEFFGTAGTTLLPAAFANAGVASLGAGVAGSFAAGVLASSASQRVGKALGVVDHFSLRSSMGEGIANAITFGISSWAQSAANAAAKAAEVAKTAGQATKAAGMSRYLRGSLQALGNAGASVVGDRLAGVEGASFSWRAVAANVVSAAITKGITHELRFGGENLSARREFAENLTTGFVGGVVSTHVRRKLGFDDEINYGVTLADAFGNALGTAAVMAIRAENARAKVDVGPLETPGSGSVTTEPQSVTISSETQPVNQNTVGNGAEKAGAIDASTFEGPTDLLNYAADLLRPTSPILNPQLDLNVLVSSPEAGVCEADDPQMQWAFSDVDSSTPVEKDVNQMTVAELEQHNRVGEIQFGKKVDTFFGNIASIVTPRSKHGEYVNPLTGNVLTWFEHEASIVDALSFASFGAEVWAGGIASRAEAAISAANGETVSIFRKMSAAEAQATLQTRRLQPASPGADPSRYLSESLAKLTGGKSRVPFQNNIVPAGTQEDILEFVLHKQGYESLMSSSVKQTGSKGIDAVKFHYEGILPSEAGLKNIGVPPTKLDEFNKLILEIRKAKGG